jgi:hypothetical protein
MTESGKVGDMGNIIKRAKFDVDRFIDEGSAGS